MYSFEEIKNRSAQTPSFRTAEAMQKDILALIKLVEKRDHHYGFPNMTVGRSEAFDAIDDERKFQDDREGDIKSNGSAGDGTRTQHEYILYITEWTNRLREQAFMPGVDSIQDNIRKVAALCVAAMEEHGSPKR